MAEMDLNRVEAGIRWPTVPPLRVCGGDALDVVTGRLLREAHRDRIE